jgi:uncharacterized protein YcbK (DUF882 family)
VPLARLVRPIASLAMVATTATVLAQPPASKHTTPQAAPRTRATNSAATSAAAAAYMAGKQPLVGWHAPSDKAVERDVNGRPMLVLTTINRGETLAIPACGEEGGFAALDLDRAAHLLRASTGDEHPVDPRTLAFVYRVENHFGVPEVRVVSGYRVPKPGSRSNHGKGRAVDLVVPGVADEEVARFARAVGFAGVGVYPTSQFVHIDIRPRSYFWVDYSGPHMRNRERGILADVAARSDAEALSRGQVAVEPFVLASDVDAALRARGITAASPPNAAEEDEEDFE